jgi:hypothetical protein
MTLLVDYNAKISLKRYVNDRIGNLHIALESQNEVSEAQLIRGQIKELRRLEAEIADPKPDQIAGTSVTY